MTVKWTTGLRPALLLTICALVLGAGWLLAGCGLSGGSRDTTTLSSFPASSTTGVISPSTTETPATTGTPTTRPPLTTAAPPSSNPPATEPPTTEKPVTTATTAVGQPAKEYTRLPGEDERVALTFDAAYDPVPLGAILAALAAADARATFFLTGEFVRDFPNETKEIVAAGHSIGNHSYSHPDFTEISDSKIREEIRKTAAALQEVGAGDPAPLFRPPYGARNNRVLSLLQTEGYLSIYWTIDTLDWKPERTGAQIKQTILSKLQPGSIVLMHVGGKETAKMLPELLQELQARGYRTVDLREAIPEAN